jgi:hypothetical protein
MAHKTAKQILEGKIANLRGETDGDYIANLGTLLAEGGARIVGGLLTEDKEFGGLAVKMKNGKVVHLIIARDPEWNGSGWVAASVVK